MMRFSSCSGLLFGLVALIIVGCSQSAETQLIELQRAGAGAVTVVLLSSSDALHQGKNSAVLEFRAKDGSLMDVGAVRVNATMPMPGMGPMLAGAEIRPTDVKGRYAVDTDFGMVGTWRITVEWDGPAGRGTASLPGTVR